jgi:molecular chaperone HtpG
MTEKELESNLGTIAKSGSFDFKADEKLKEEDINIIGQFGVGFYSAFMVAKKVEVITKAYGESEAYKWTSKGAEGYEIEKCEKASNGTDIILYIKEDEGGDNYSTYLEEYTIRSLVRKYSDYIRYPIIMDVTKYKPQEEGKETESYKEKETLNSMVPIWKKSKSEVTKEEYEEFYKSNFFDNEAPIKTIQMSVEGAVDYKALLFIPKNPPYNYYSKQYEKGLKLYTNGVMIMERCGDLLPDYFSFVKGVVDSEITLNISREAVQQTRQIKAISQSIEKKIKSELLDLQKNNREDYEKFYEAFGVQLKFGIYQSFGMN